MRSSEFTVQLSGIGETVIYREGNAEYHFDVTWNGSTPTLYYDKYWDGTGTPAQTLTVEQERRIVPRINEFLNTWGDKTPVGVVFLKNAQTGVYQRVESA